MTDVEKRKRINKYFANKFNRIFYLILFGVTFVMMGAIGGSFGVIGVGVVSIVLGALVNKNAGKGRPTDDEMDKYIAEDLSIASHKAIQKAGLDESELVGDPLSVTGPRPWNRAGAAWKFKKGKDDILRFSPINIMVLALTQNQVITYQACLDLSTGNYLNESTDEYFYSDIVSIATKTESRAFQGEGLGKIQLKAAETFVLTTSGGTSVETVLRDPKLVKMMGGKGSIPTTDAERVIQIVRKMLREKKAA